MRETILDTNSQESSRVVESPKEERKVNLEVAEVELEDSEEPMNNQMNENSTAQIALLNDL